MSESANLLMIEFLAWIASRRRTYEPVQMELDDAVQSCRLGYALTMS